MKFERKGMKCDPVITYVSEDGFYKIVKRPSEQYWQLKRISLFNILGDVIGEFNTLEEAIEYFA